MEKNTLFLDLDDLLDEHGCDDWDEFRSFVHRSTENRADVGHIEGFNGPEGDGDFGVFFITENETSRVLYFPFYLNQFNAEIDQLDIF